MLSKELDQKAMERAASLEALGLDKRLAANAGAAAKTATALASALADAGLTAESPDAEKATLVYTAVTKMGSPVGISGRNVMLAAIKDERLTDIPHVEAAAAWLTRQYKERRSDVPNAQVVDDLVISEEEFAKAAGVGVTVTHDDMKRAVESAVNDIFDELVDRRYRYNTGILQRRIMEDLRFADGKVINELIRQNVEQILGPKTEQDLAKPAKVKKPKIKPQKTTATDPGNEPSADPFESVPSRFEARGLSSAENTPELLEKHRAMTGGKIITRFPPEPNGYLHVGHAKAMFIDFGYAKKMNGDCILRFDDTNPSVEKTEYTEAIQEMVKWMGHRPVKVTYSSDYFEELYELALDLVRRGKAYVCHQTGDELSRDRKEGVESPYRNRGIEENLKLFSDMRKGKFGEGEATLRMKIDMQHPNLAMRDPIAYRVLLTPHPHVGDKWCIYPSYDYTHCIVDSLEWVTHSLCTLEFEIRRDSYYWLLEALDLYRPFVWESARLNLEHTVMSKRKLKQLVECGYVRGWDDPRMPTLVGMRRRGYTADALNRFCAAIGVSRSSNMIGMHVLEHWVRTEHDAKAKRVMAVLRPLKTTIRNFRGDEMCEAPYHPKNESMGGRKLPLSKTVFIERADFRMKDSKNYFGLAPNKTAMLRHAYPVKVVEVVTSPDNNDEPVELIVEMDYEKSVKPKGVLHWVDDQAKKFQTRLYSTLFKSADPLSLKGDWLEDLNDESEIVIDGALIEQGASTFSVGTTVQFERTGYFTVDIDSTDERVVYNMTVSLRDSR